MEINKSGTSSCNLLMKNKRDKNSSGTEAESERSKVATGREAPPKPDPLTAPTALQPSCSLDLTACIISPAACISVPTACIISCRLDPTACISPI